MHPLTLSQTGLVQQRKDKVLLIVHYREHGIHLVLGVNLRNLAALEFTLVILFSDHTFSCLKIENVTVKRIDLHYFVGSGERSVFRTVLFLVAVHEVAKHFPEQRLRDLIHVPDAAPFLPLRCPCLEFG